MTTQISTIKFHNQTLLTLEQDNIQYVAMRPICENIGLTWSSQFDRISRDEVLKSVVLMIRTTGSDGKNYQMLCLPIQYLNGWLFGIDVKRVKPEIREKLITIKKNAIKRYLIIGINKSRNSLHCRHRNKPHSPQKNNAKYKMPYKRPITAQN